MRYVCIGSIMTPTAVALDKKVIQHLHYFANMISHPDQPSNFISVDWQRLFAQIIGIQHSPVSQILHQCEVARVAGVIAYIELEIMHS